MTVDSFIATTDSPDGAMKDITFFHRQPGGNVVVKRPDGAKDIQITVPLEHLLKFVASLVRDERVREIEWASARQILGLKDESV